MSDLYLVLRRRLEDVAAHVEWVVLGTDTLKSARNGLGYSYEAMGRQLNVSAKTYERYEKAGHVPRHMLPRVASVLELEITQPEQVRVDLPDRGDLPAAAATITNEISSRFDEIDAALRLLLDGQQQLLERVLRDVAPSQQEAPPARRR